MKFTTVFDIAHQGYTDWRFPAFILIFVFVGALMVFQPGLIQTLLPYGIQGKARRIFSWLFFIFTAAVALVAFVITYSQYRVAAYDLDHGRYKVAEGPVTNFVPMPRSGHGMESFCVQGRCFSYSDYIVTAGFHRTAVDGGPIRDGVYVRIAYSGNLILRLDVAR